MNHFHRIALIGLVSALLPVGISIAQRPLSDDIVLAAFPARVQAEYSPHPACDDAGTCGLFWFANHLDPDNNKVDILATAISPQGAELVQPRVLATVDFPTGPLAVGLERGFAVLWESPLAEGHASPVLQYYDESLVLQKTVTLPFVFGAAGFHNPLSYGAFFDIVRTPSGFALYAGAIDNPSLTYSVFVFFIDRGGRAIRPRQRLNDTTSVQLLPTFNGLAVQPNGDLVAVYWGGDNAATNVYMRRLAANGQLLGSEKIVNTEHHASQGLPVVATSSDGSFLVAWQSSPVPNTTSDILARRYSARGQALEKPFQVNNVHQLDQRRPAITSDAQGNYFIAWQSFIPPYNWDIKGRLFRHDGTPVADEFRLNQVRQFAQDIPHVTFSPTGTIIAGWESASPRQKGIEELVPVARVFSVVPKPASADLPVRLP